MENNYKEYAKIFKVAIGILAGAILLFILMIAKTVPEIQKISTIQNEYKTSTASLADAERKLENLRNNAEEKRAENENLLKAFFKPITTVADTEAAISDEFGEVLQIMREHKIKARSIKYDYDPQDDNFVKNAASRYHVCRVTAEMIANYSNFENFLRELYKHEHFIEISKIEIVPYQKNKRILLINLQFKLYAQRDPSTYVAPVQPAPEETQDNSNKKATAPKSIEAVKSENE